MWREPAGATAKRPRTVAMFERHGLHIRVLQAGVHTDPPRYRALVTRDGRLVQTVDIAAHSWRQALDRALESQQHNRGSVA